MKQLLKLLLYITFTLGVVSCIGKVEDKNPNSSKNAETGSEEISFSGVSKVTAISHDKVEVNFLPATGNQSDLTYLINVNNTSSPVEVKGESLQLTESGNYSFIVDNLIVNSTYNFSVGLKNSRTGVVTKNDKSLSAKTFGNYTASFSGLASVNPVAGEAGQTTVKVSWIPALSLGSTFSPRATDPIAYEVAYISSADGGPNDFSNSSSSAVTKVLKPTTLGSSPQLSSEREREISGLIPGVKYYFRVRALHRAYVDFSEIEGYQYEQNNKILAVTTLSSTGLFDWDTNSFSINTPDGDLALSKLDLRWQSASGPFFGYRIYSIKVGEPADDPVDVEANAPSIDEAKINAMNSVNDFVAVAAEARFYRLENLDEYAYYKIAVVACRNLSCTEGQRIVGNSILTRVTPKIAPFSGLLRISNPDSLSSLDKIKVNFDAPVISSGFINKFELYCFENEGDNSPSELLYNIVNSSAKPNCNGLTRLTESPVTFSAFSSFKEITIQGTFFTGGSSISDKVYCFGAIPVIEGNNFVLRDVNSAIIRCRPIEIKVPTMIEFPGVTPGCSAGADSLNISWPVPTGGLYDRYELFYKTEDGQAFNFSKAIAGDVSYTKVDDLTTNTYTISGLMPGEKYQYGVLAYISGGTKIYSEINASIGDCSIPYPVPKFNEWVDIFAIGPKADGRIDPLPGTKDKTYLFETINDQGQPVEVEVGTSDFAPTTAFIDQFGDISGSVELSGVYGSNKNNAAAGKHIYSNTGVIRFAWKDVTFNSSSLSMNDLITSFEVAIQKKDRKFGYKVYRSHDSQATWVELTNKDFDFQTIQNSGLLHPIDYSERVRPNAPEDTFKAVMFTDYSVNHIKNNNGVNRARVYYYKVIPVFNNVELKYESENINPQHIIKVVLPPENMALVHRLMANRQTCLEIGKSIVKDTSKFYTCSWNGVGARGLGVPWVSGQTIYDFGESLLIDRYEMGCDYTRGDYANLNSTFTGASFDFKGLSDNASSFVGCLVDNSVANNPSNTSAAEHPGGSTYSSHDQFRVGDCIGDYETSIYNSATTCADPAKSQKHIFIYPGLPGSGGFTDCTLTSNISTDFFNNYGDATKVVGKSAQSEFASVFYNRANSVSDWSYQNLYLRGASGSGINDGNDITFSTINGRRPSRCSINIPVQDNTAIVGVGEGRLKPRWIAINYLDQLSRQGSNFSILSDTLNEVIANANMFDATLNAVPGSSLTNLVNSPRYSGDSTLARIISSNDSKLPPLDGLSQSQANEVCSNYELEVGILSTSNIFTQIGNKKNKRLMRRTEGIVAGAYPRNFDENDVSELELGTKMISPVSSGTSINSSCNVHEREVEDGLLSGGLLSGKDMSANIAGNINGDSTTPSHPLFWSGSSFYDKKSNLYNTQSCISKFGLQDLVGNMNEYSSEQIFCDFSGEKLYLGVNGSVPDSVQVSDGIHYNSASLASWVQSSPDTGRCSVIESGSARTAVFNNSGFHIPIFDLFGNLNTSMITANSQFDTRAIGNLRNGDGFFLDFGQNNLGPPISLNDTLALTNNPELLARSRDGTDKRRGRYFNPVIGLPLECPTTYCNDSSDNKTITTDDFVTDFSLTPGDFSIADFPVGNSQILSDGMSEINTTVGFYKSPDTYSYNYDFINSVDTGAGTTVSYSSQNAGALKSSQDNDNTSIDRTHWRVSRGTPLYFQNFGKSNQKNSGRYSANMRGITKTWQYARDVGFRCAVRLGNLEE